MGMKPQELETKISSDGSFPRPRTAGRWCHRETLADGTQIYVKDLCAKLDTDAEELSYLVARAIEAPVPAVHRVDDKQLVLEVVDGTEGYNFTQVAHTREAQLVGLLDVLINNIDRPEHKNWINKEGTPWAIDHHLTWQGYYNSAFSKNLDITRFTAAHRLLIARALHRLEPAFIELDHEKWYRLMMQRWTDIRKGTD